MKLTIEKIIYPGKSLAKKNNKVIFTDEGISGEVVNVKILKEKKNFAQGVTQSVITASAKRKSPECAHYKICSPYQYIDYDQQLQIKKAQIAEMFSHSLKVNFPEISIQRSPAITGYRNKIHLHIIRSKNNLSYAYHLPEHTNKFIAIDTCSLASKEMNDFLKRLLNLLQKNKITYVRAVTLRSNFEKNQLLASLHGIFSSAQIKQLKQITAVLSNEFPLNGIVYINSKIKITEILHGKNCINETVFDKKFSFGIESFFQINIPLLKTLIKDLKNLINLTGSEIIVDLYSGVGTLAIIVAAEAKKVIAVEISRHNTAFLKHNIQVNALKNIQVYKSSCEEQINIISQVKPVLLIVDPPRSGLSKIVAEELAAQNINFIAYISCDPATLMRDLKILLNKYSLEKIFIYDFFPQTPHIETLVILKKI